MNETGKQFDIDLKLHALRLTPSVCARVGTTDAGTAYGSVLTINTACETSGAGPEDVFLRCPDETRGNFVTVQRMQTSYDPSRSFLVIVEIDVHVGIENGMVSITFQDN